MSQICVVCKTPIDDALVVETDRGPCHPGQCYNYAESLPVTESAEEQLNCLLYTSPSPRDCS